MKKFYKFFFFIILSFSSFGLKAQSLIVTAGAITDTINDVTYMAPPVILPCSLNDSLYEIVNVKTTIGTGNTYIIYYNASGEHEDLLVPGTVYTDTILGSTESEWVASPNVGFIIMVLTPQVFVLDSAACNHKSVVELPAGLNDDTDIVAVSWNIGNTGITTGLGIYTDSAYVTNADSSTFTAYVVTKEGCHDTASVTVKHKSLTGNLCWVTVDSNSKYNVVIWDTTAMGAQNVDSVKIYFYNPSNQWQLLAEKPYNVDYFVDSLNNPNITTVRYRLTTVDECGSEEPINNSPYQNTMWITNNGTGTFSWSGTGYLIENNSNPVLTYTLYRDSISNGNWKSIGAVSGTQNVISDPNYANFPNGRWYVGATLNISGCPAAPIINQRSETSANTVSWSNSISKNPTSVNTIQNSSLIKVYPNPFTNNINVELKTNSTVELLDVTGRVIFSATGIAGHNAYSVKLSEGMYFLRINGIVTEKMVMVN